MPKNCPISPRNAVRFKSERCPTEIGTLSGSNRNHCPNCPGIRIQVQRTFDRRTGELNGSLSGSARFTLLPYNYGQHSIFTESQPGAQYQHSIESQTRLSMQYSGTVEFGLFGLWAAGSLLLSWLVRRRFYAYAGSVALSAPAIAYSMVGYGLLPMGGILHALIAGVFALPFHYFFQRMRLRQ